MINSIILNANNWIPCIKNKKKNDNQQIDYTIY